MVGGLDRARGDDAGAVSSASARVAQPDAPTDLRAAFVARYARLKAEAEGMESITFPAELLSRLGEQGVANALHEERVAFATRKQAFSTRAAELEHAMRLAKIEVKFVEEKRDALSLHVEALRTALANHDHLAAKGQALAIDRLNLSQRLVDYEVMLADVELSLAKMRDEMTTIEGNETDLPRQYREQVNADLTELRLTYGKRFSANPEIAESR
jgi:hypothetical protein